MTSKRTWNELSSAQQGVILAAGAVQVLLLAAALLDLRTRSADQINGSKRTWTLVALINFVGPIAYFLFGRRRTA